MNKILFSILSIAVAIVIVGGTVAYFSDVDMSEFNTFAAAELEINVDQETNVYTTDFTGMYPGDEIKVRFDVVNSNDIPVILRGYAIGEWAGVANPDNRNMQVTKVEYYSGEWTELIASPDGLEGEYYYSSDGTSSGTMIPLSADGTKKFRLTVKFDESAGNEYQNETYSANIVIEGTQVDNVNFE